MTDTLDPRDSMAGYNPIIRTFNQLRAALARTAGLGPREIRPGTPLEPLLPRDRRREMWRELQTSGLPLPNLLFPGRLVAVGCLGGIAIVAAATSLNLWAALLLVVPFWWLLFVGGRHLAIELPTAARTVGELALYLTCPGDHRGSGHQLTRNEIAIKVRLTIAEAMNLDPDEVRMRSTFRALGVG